MTVAVAYPLLDAVRRRLQWQRLATALRVAAWTTAAILGASVLVHLFARRLDLRVVVAIATLPWIVAMLWSWGRRITRAECAAWADRHLGGASAYATLLETLDHPSPATTSAAVERLVQWIETAAPRSLAQLQGLPLRMRLSKPVLTVFVCAAVSAVLMQIPGRSVAPPKNQSLGAATQRDESGTSAPSARDDLPVDADATAAVAHRNASPPDRGQARELALANADSNASEGDAPPVTVPQPGGTGNRASPGGRDAGDSPDTVADTGFSESWQGELAGKLLTSTAALGDATARADPTLTADFSPAIGPVDAATAPTGIAPAPATPPEARARARLGPAEQAYVRAYFADSGTKP